MFASIEAFNITFPAPVNPTTPAVISPVIEKFLLEANAVAVEALPATLPINEVACNTLFATNLVPAWVYNNVAFPV